MQKASSSKPPLSLRLTFMNGEKKIAPQLPARILASAMSKHVPLGTRQSRSERDATQVQPS